MTTASGAKFDMRSGEMMSPEFNDFSSSLGCADTHIYYVFQSQLELENNIEKVKIQLSLKTDFNLIDAFRIFNESGSGSACVQDMIQGLKELGLHVGDDQMSLFMARFDQDHDRKLRYSEFCQAFLPQDSFHASLLAKKAPLTMYPQSLVPKQQIFYPETTELFLQAWTTHLENEIQAEQLRILT